MKHTNVISFYPNETKERCESIEFRHRSSFRAPSGRSIEQWLQAAELTVTGLIGAGFCFCIVLVVTML